jgi:hypothetical protein
MVYGSTYALRVEQRVVPYSCGSPVHVSQGNKKAADLIRSAAFVFTSG